MGSFGVLLQLTGVLNMKEPGPGAPSPVPAEAEGLCPCSPLPLPWRVWELEDGAASPRTPGRAQQAPLRAGQHHVPCGNTCQPSQSPEVQGDGDLKENKTASPCNMPEGRRMDSKHPVCGGRGKPRAAGAHGREGFLEEVAWSRGRAGGRPRSDVSTTQRDGPGLRWGLLGTRILGRALSPHLRPAGNAPAGPCTPRCTTRRSRK